LKSTLGSVVTVTYVATGMLISGKGGLVKIRDPMEMFVTIIVVEVV
jgi:hypothetical protein